MGELAGECVLVGDLGEVRGPRLYADVGLGDLSQAMLDTAGLDAKRGGPQGEARPGVA